MKVLMIASWYPTKDMPLLGSFFKEQAQAMKKAGLDMAVIHVLVGSKKGQGLQIENIEGIPTAIYTRINLTPKFEVGRRIQRTLMLKKAYKELTKQWGKPDLVNLRSSLHGYEALSLCKSENLPLFFMEHSSHVMTEPTNSSTHKRLKKVMQYAGVNAAVSNAVKDRINDYASTRVIPDPIDGEIFKPIDGIPKNKVFTFKAMGQLRPIKAYDMLIKAFAILVKQKKQNVKLEIAGKGTMEENLNQLIRKLDISDCCKLVGNVPRSQVPMFMNTCDCFISSSNVETLSCVLNEAAACGKPVISTMSGGPQDIVTPETGLLVPVGDKHAMADAMYEMIHSVDKYNSEVIRNLTLKRFGKDVVTKQLVVACNDAITNLSNEV